MVIFVTSFALAGSRVSLTGGMYAYVETAFGRFSGFIAGVLYFLTAILATSGIVSLFADTIGAISPFFAGKVTHFLIVLLVLGSLAWTNIRGVRAGARAVWIITIVKLIPLLIFVCAGIFFVRRSDALTMVWPGVPALGRSVLILLFAFVGIEVALIPSGEVKDPARTVPRAIYLALAITTALYLLIQFVAQGILGQQPWPIFNCTSGGSGFTFSRRAGPHSLARRREHFSVRFHHQRYPQFSPHPFCLWA